jgi:hypothetical protein
MILLDRSVDEIHESLFLISEIDLAHSSSQDKNEQSSFVDVIVHRELLWER